LSNAHIIFDECSISPCLRASLSYDLANYQICLVLGSQFFENRPTTYTNANDRENPSNADMLL